MKYFFQTIWWNPYFTVVSLCKTEKCPWYTFWDISWNIKILKIDFQNFLYHERLYYWICFRDWLTLLLSMASTKVSKKMWALRESKQSGFHILRSSRLELFFKKGSWKRDSGTGIFLRTHFYRTPLAAASVFYITKFEGYWR